MKYYHANCPFECVLKGEGTRGKGNACRHIQVCKLKTQHFLLQMPQPNTLTYELVHQIFIF